MSKYTRKQTSVHRPNNMIIMTWMHTQHLPINMGSKNEPNCLSIKLDPLKVTWHGLYYAKRNSFSEVK